MLEHSNLKPATHLTNLIVTRNRAVPNFALLLGSGASATSGVSTAQEMVETWRKQLFDRTGLGGDPQDWLDSQYWYKHDDEYSMLFEEFYDQAAQRRVYVEECIDNAKPGWGYVYLTNLLYQKFFDVVFTTNFDDLINEACYLYSEEKRPIVAAHDSAIQGIRVTSGRPKIIKLHGDFLYDNIKNTLAELETLETNTKRKLNQFAKEYGLVVLGYSGRDRSVMDTLDLLLRDEDNYKQGVYWCVRKGEQLSGRLASLLKRDRVYLVEITGFDEFAAELHQAAELDLPRPIAHPIDMAKDRARLFVEVDETLQSHPVISAHIDKVLGGVNIREPKLPLSVEAAVLSARGELAEALPVWEQSHNESPDNKAITIRYANALADAGRSDELARLMLDSPVKIDDATYYLLRAGKNEIVIDVATESLGNSDVKDEHAISHMVTDRINRAIAFKRLGRIDEMDSDLNILKLNGDTNDVAIKAGVAALEKKREEMFDALREALPKKLSPEMLRKFPVFEDYQDDEEFLEFVALAKSKLPRQRRMREHSTSPNT